MVYRGTSTKIIEHHGLSSHLYADDPENYGSCRPNNTDQLMDLVTHCFNDVAAWMQSSRLQLNADKSELMWFTTQRRQHQLPVVVISFDGLEVLSVSTARNLGVYFDSGL
jgi:hypothetical protein